MDEKRWIHTFTRRGAITAESELLPQVVTVDALAEDVLATARRRVGA